MCVRERENARESESECERESDRVIVKLRASERQREGEAERSGWTRVWGVCFPPFSFTLTLTTSSLGECERR